jgi:serine/threonine-protein kinase
MANPGAEVEVLKTPSMLDDKYRIDDLLAVGGMGAVYRGRHMQLHKTVAIKVLRRSLMGHPELVERFQREAIAASQIGHEGIIEVTDVGTSSDGDPFLVMEYLVGCDLAGCLKDCGALRTEVAVRICCEILSAVAAAHDQDIIHRDLKPENVYVCRRARGELIKILDFGISRMPIKGDDSMRLTTTGLVMGTPYYMSPEQALGESSVGKPADLYSVAVILYELVTGALPFKATNYNALLHQILVGQFDPPSSLANIPPELEAVMLKGMAFNPEDRYPNARAFASALKRFAETSSSSILPAFTPHPDTFDDAAPVVATAPTRVEPAVVSRTSAATVSGSLPASALRAPDTPVPAGTLEPVVTPVPPAEMPVRAPRRSPAFAGALVLLLIAGGSALLLTRDDGGKDDAPQSVSASQPESPVPAPAATEPNTAEAGEPEKVTLSFAVDPEDASIFIDGELLTDSSLQLPMSETPVLVEVKKEGYKTRTQSITPSEDRALAFALGAIEKPATTVIVELPDKNLTTTGKKTKPKSDKGKKGDKKTGRRFVGDSPYDAP